MNFDSLKLLTTQQALKDIAYFIRSMNVKYGFTNPRWVTFGGSYPGSLSAWFRSKYPDLTVGAVASSAPLNLKLNMYEYAMVVENDLKITNPECPAAVKMAFDQMQKLSMTKAGRSQLNTYFKLVKTNTAVRWEYDEAGYH
uniref:Serine protease K12H4.7 n=1 Tax=Heterorhabditis bacteriophora TaxID=37862 RepID=A0A1I7XIP5_HETBA